MVHRIKFTQSDWDRLQEIGESLEWAKKHGDDTVDYAHFKVLDKCMTMVAKEKK